MLKLFIQVECDSCGEHFLFARASANTTDSLSFNASALTAMLPHYHWRLTKQKEASYHYCPECCYDFDEMQQWLACH